MADVKLYRPVPPLLLFFQSAQAFTGLKAPCMSSWYRIVHFCGESCAKAQSGLTAIVSGPGPAGWTGRGSLVAELAVGRSFWAVMAAWGGPQQPF